MATKKKREGGLFAYEIGPEEKTEYIELLYQGIRANLAAEQAGSTGSRFRKHRSPNSQYFDPEFAAACEEAEKSPEARREFEERIRDKAMELFDSGQPTIVWKMMLTYLPEYEWAKHQNLNMNVQMRVLTQALPALTNEELERVEQSLLAGEQPQLKALPPVIEAA